MLLLFYVFLKSIDFLLFFLKKLFVKQNKTKKQNFMAKKKENEVEGEKKTFFSKFRRTPKNEVPEAVEITISSARKTKKPQISSDDLSHAGKHLLLLVQHAVDEHKVFVFPEHRSWTVLEQINPKFVEKKEHIKWLCNIRQFANNEKNVIADRVVDFIQTHQPKMILTMDEFQEKTKPKPKPKPEKTIAK